MTLSDVKTIIEVIFTSALILAGGLKTLMAASEALKQKANEEKALALTKDKQEVELTERLQRLSADLLSQMETRCAVIQSRLEATERDNRILRQSGLGLITGIVNSLRAREVRSDPGCLACLTGDHELLAGVLKVKDLFEKGDF